MIIIFIFLAAISLSFLMNNEQVYLFVFDHKAWKQWNYFIKNADKFEFDSICCDRAIFTFKEYRAIIWLDGLTSIHDNTKCIVSTFYKHKSRKMTKLLEDNIPFEIEYNFKQLKL